MIRQTLKSRGMEPRFNGSLRRALKAGAATTFLAALVLTSPSTLLAQQKNLQLVLDCVKMDRRNPVPQAWVAYFGYINPNPTPYEPGPNGSYINGKTGQGTGTVPTVLLPGEHHFAVQVAFDEPNYRAQWTVWPSNPAANAFPNEAATFQSRQCPSFNTQKGDWTPSPNQPYIDGDVVRYKGEFYAAYPDSTSANTIAVVNDPTQPPDVSPEWLKFDDSTSVLVQPAPSSNLSASDWMFIGANGSAMITDPHVTPSSMVILQYRDGTLPGPVLESIATGVMLVMGVPNKQFRYLEVY